MLNEILEFKMYTDPKQQFQRLNHGELKNSFRGISRPLTIIARYYMFLDDKNAPNFELAKCAINAWLSGENESVEYKDTLAEIAGWFPRYVEKDNINSEKIAKLSDRVFYSIFQKEFKDASLNTTNQIKYRKILSNAMQDGPLKRYYLVCDCNEKEYLKQLYACDLSTNTSIKMGNPFITKLQKVLSAYLLEVNKTPHTFSKQYGPYVHLSIIDIANWQSLKKVDQLFSSFTQHNGTVFINNHELIKTTDFGDSYKLFTFDTSWIKHFSVIEESKLEEWINKHPNGIFYSDNGIGRDALLLNTKY